MRLWSLHPKYLDSKGLVALWREGLLAKHVLEGKTKGYKNHPQLNRFKASANPIEMINAYLYVVYQEASKRGYHFNKDKILPIGVSSAISVTSGQVVYEFKHLLSKLSVRDVERFKQFENLEVVECHPLFLEVPGEIEDFEVL
jgi:hypothetical protein